MRSTAVSMAALLVVAGVACDRASANDARLSEELERDLAAATSATLELAGSAQGYQPMRFVSEVEQIRSSAPAPREPASAARPERPIREAPAPLPEPPAEPLVEPVVTESPDAPEEDVVADAPRVPVVAPRPSPMPVDVPESGGSVGPRRGTEGPDWIDVVGVVIRGGRVGDKHCPPRRPRGPIILPFPQRNETAPPVLRPIIHP